MLLSFFLVYVIGIIISDFVLNWNILRNPEILYDYTSAETIKILKFFQFIQSTGLFIIPPLVFAYLVYPTVWGYLRLNNFPAMKVLLLAVVAGIFFLPFSNLLGWFNSFLELPPFMSGIESWMRSAEDTASEITTAFLNVNTVDGLLINIVLIAVIPAIGEELLFRGVLQRVFSEWTKSCHWGIFISAFIFSAIHLQFYGFLPRLFLGLFFGYLLEYSRSLWIPVLTHFINNFAGVLLSFFIAKDIFPQSANDFGMTSGTWFFGIIGGLGGGIILILIIRKSNRVL